MSAVQRYGGGSALASIQEELNRLMSRHGWGRPFDSTSEGEAFVQAWSPAIDIKEEKNEYIVHVDIPGVDAKDIEVTLDNSVLTIRGERTEEKKADEDGFHRVERFNGSFFRRFTLPEAGDAEKVKAKSHNGVLEIRVPKTHAPKARRIAVES